MTVPPQGTVHEIVHEIKGCLPALMQDRLSFVYTPLSLPGRQLIRALLDMDAEAVLVSGVATANYKGI